MNLIEAFFKGRLFCSWAAFGIFGGENFFWWGGGFFRKRGRLGGSSPGHFIREGAIFLRMAKKVSFVNYFLSICLYTEVVVSRGGGMLCQTYGK